MSALERWRERCLSNHRTVVFAYFEGHAEELLQSLAKEDEGHKNCVDCIAARLALQWLREEMERGE